MADEKKKISQLDEYSGSVSDLCTIGTKENAAGNPLSYKVPLTFLQNAADAAKTQAAEAKSQAESASKAAAKATASATGADTSAANAEAATSKANTAAEKADAAAASATDAAAKATTAATSATSAADKATTAAGNVYDAISKANTATENANKAAEGVEKMQTGLFAIAFEEGEFSVITNAESTAFQSGEITEDGEIVLTFNC